MMFTTTSTQELYALTFFIFRRNKLEISDGDDAAGQGHTQSLRRIHQK